MRKCLRIWRRTSVTETVHSTNPNLMTFQYNWCHAQIHEYPKRKKRIDKQRKINKLHRSIDPSIETL